MKNNLKCTLIGLFFLMQYSGLLSQSSFDEFSLSLDIAPIDDAHLYIPDSGNPIALWGKSDLKFSIDNRIGTDISYGRYNYSSNHHKPTQFKVGYSFHPKFYTTLSWVQSKGNVRMSGLYEERLFLGDFGIGTSLVKIDEKERYTPFLKYNAKWMMKKGAQVNALLGYSRGRIQHERSYGFADGEFNFNRFYGQVGLHFQRGIWGFSGSSKFGFLNYQKVKIIGNAVFDLAPLSDLLMDQNNFLFIETSMRFYLGTRFGQVYLNRVFAKTNAALSKYIISDYISVGAVLDIQGFYRKKKKE